LTPPEVLIPEIVPPETQAEAAGKEADTLITASYLVKIETQADYKLNAAHIVRLKAGLKDLEEKRVSITGPINKSLKAVNDLFRTPADVIKAVIEKVEWPMKVYIREEDRKRQEAEAKERQRLADEKALQEKNHKEAEAKLEEARKAEDAAKEAVTTETNPFLAATRQAEAQNAKEAVQEVSNEVTGAIREIARIEQAPVSVSAPKILAAGTRIYRPYKWEFDGEPLDPAFMMPNEQLINATVRIQKGATKIKGIRVFQDISIGGR